MLVPTYSRLERGGANPSLNTMVRIAEALDVPVIELLQSSEIKDKSVAQKLEMVESRLPNKFVPNLLGSPVWRNYRM